MLQESDDTEVDSDQEEDDPDKEEGSDYDYLLGMAMWNLTKEKKDALMQKEQEKIHELNSLQVKTPESIWVHDLKHLREEVCAMDT